MIGISIISHGNLANGLKDSCELIIGAQAQFSTVGLRDADDFDEFKLKVLNSIQEVNNGNGVLVFVDLFGASPFNSVMFAFPQLTSNVINVKMITGVNLPKVIKACEKRDLVGIDELFNQVIQTGKECIIGLDDMIKQTV